jgi:hypothetical protein
MMGVFTVQAALTPRPCKTTFYHSACPILLPEHLLDMSMRKELPATMTDDDLEVSLDGIRTILVTEEKTGSDQKQESIVSSL